MRPAVIERQSGRERAIPLPEIDGDAPPLVDRDDIQQTVAVEVGCFGHPYRRVRRAEGDPPEVRVRRAGTTEIHMTLAAVTMRHSEIDQSVMIEVSRGDGRRGFV